MTAKKASPQKSHCNIGALRQGGEGKHAYPKRIELDPPNRVTNSSQRDPYIPPSWPVRAGADQHLNYRSKA